MTRTRLTVDVNSVFHLPGKHNQKSHGNRAGKKNNTPATTSKHAPLSPDATSAQIEERVAEIYEENNEAPAAQPSVPLAPFEFDERAENAATGDDAFSALKFSTLRQASDHVESAGGSTVGVSHYKEGGFVEVNNSLRLGMKPRASDDPDAQLWERVTNGMDAVASVSETKQDIIAYRGIRSPTTVFGNTWRAQGSNVGLEWQDDGFTSTSVDRNIASQFSDDYEGNGVLMRILIPRGSRAFTPDNPGATLAEEREIIIDRQSRYRVVRDEMEWDDETDEMTHFVDVEVIQ